MTQDITKIDKKWFDDLILKKNDNGIIGFYQGEEYIINQNYIVDTYGTFDKKEKVREQLLYKIWQAMKNEKEDYILNRDKLLKIISQDPDTSSPDTKLLQSLESKIINYYANIQILTNMIGTMHDHDNPDFSFTDIIIKFKKRELAA